MRQRADVQETDLHEKPRPALAMLTPEALRSNLLPAMRKQEARWLRLDGLSLSDANVHRGFCHALAACGFDIDAGTKLPSTVVLDWRGSACCTAEGLAFFTVLVRVLAARGIKVFVCLPDRSDSAEIIAESGIEACGSAAEWIHRDCSGRRAARPLTRTAIFNTSSRSNLGQFCSDLSDSLAPLFSARSHKLVMGVVLEVLQNILAHAQATNCAVSALYLTSRRPPVVQIGFADDGRGIPSSLTENPKHSWVTYLHDASVTERVVRGALTKRPESEGTEATSTGGMGLLVRRLLDECRGEIYLRSGAALLSARSDRPTEWTKSFLDHGLGTQLRIAISIENGG